MNREYCTLWWIKVSRDCYLNFTLSKRTKVGWYYHSVKIYSISQKLCQTRLVWTSRLSHCARSNDDENVADCNRGRVLATLSRHCLHVRHANRKWRPSKRVEKKKALFEVAKITDKIYFLFKPTAIGWTQQGRKTNKVDRIKQCLDKQRQQMSFLDRKCVAFVQRKHNTRLTGC